MVPPGAEDDGIAPELPHNTRRLRVAESIEGSASRTPERSPHNLPSALSSFVGREKTTLGADLGHDTTERLGEISAPSLVIGGTEDPFYSEHTIRETTEKIPDATLSLYEGVGHGVPKERKRRYEQDALAFLADHREEWSGKGERSIPIRAEETR